MTRDIIYNQTLSDLTEAMRELKRHHRIKCDECDVNYVEKRGDICEGCKAYREHTGHF